MGLLSHFFYKMKKNNFISLLSLIYITSTFGLTRSQHHGSHSKLDSPGPGWSPENSILSYEDRRNHKIPCRDTPIEVREKNASIIFTGTIREMEADWSEPGTKQAKVEVKRVLKGGFLLSRVPRVSRDEEGLARRGRRIVVVTGIGSNRICDSDARVYDTKIFLVTVLDSGALSLNSSLIRITLDNIEQTEAAVKGKHANIPHHSKREFQQSDRRSTDESSRSTTSPRRVDRTVVSNTAAPRLIETSTPSTTKSTTTATTTTTTRRTSTRYSSTSTSRPSTSARRTTTEATTTQFIDPCLYKTCSYGQVCQYDLSLSLEARCVCPQACPLNYLPVCGTDGVTYPNECSLRATACTTQTHIDIDRRYNGECPRPDPCASKTCHYGAQCVPGVDGYTARCMCVERCDQHGDDVGSQPVCGSDGRDYINECEMLRTACSTMKVIEKKFNGKCDPCDGLECSISQVCQLDMVRRPVCRCDPDLCPMAFHPVCGNDGKTYSTECIMRVDGCRRNLDIQLLYRGECSSGNNPCSDVVCAPGQHCMVNNRGEGVCQCPGDCEPVYRPVCGNDGRTYDSECHLAEHACVTKQPIRFNYTGECDKVGSCATHRCQAGAQCVLRNGLPKCICPSCSEEFKPVCGSNHVTFVNECKLRNEACMKNNDVTVAYDGPCDPCRNMKCDFYATCVADQQNVGTCECPSNCEQVESRVCGNDRQTYLNECEMKMKSCHLQKIISISSHGPCDPCANVECKHGSVCDAGKCVCQRESNCKHNNQPICATDGITYPNECAMRYAGCSQSVNIEVLYPGECEMASGSGDVADLCDSINCKFGGTCKVNKQGSIQCHCEFNCNALRSPVCGSDGRMYGNECHVKEESCKRQSHISVQPMDYCGGFDIDEEICDGKPPVINSRTGREYNCQAGHDNCPPGSYCHQVGSLMRCCSQDGDMVKKCAESQYGCCTDGITTAQGPNDLGCPKVNECQCNELGSNGTHCDPVTSQCACKYGVGGLKCDRCQPSFWGLPLISEGNTGCLACGCNEYGSLRTDCEQMTGRCVCKPGATGQKCDVCSNGRPLGPEGCSEVMLNDRLESRKSCSERTCQFGAVCEDSARGQTECVCPSDCQPGEDRQTLVCGTDGQTYGSICQLKLFACRLQRDIRALHYGQCGVPPGHRKEPADSKSQRIGEARSSRITKDLNNPNKYSRAFGMLNDHCHDNQGCYVENSFCNNGLCMCKSPLVASEDRLLCIEEGFTVPSFSGKSYITLRPPRHGSRDLSIELEFQPQRSSGLILYTGQNDNGTGDFLSIALNHGFVEFRYDLGSGPAFLKSRERVKLDSLHKLTVMRFGRDSALKLDNNLEVTGSSQGVLRSLNVETPLYLGLIPRMADITKKRIEVDTGYVGCIKTLKIKSSESSLDYDLNKRTSREILQQDQIYECGKSACSSYPCLNGGHCLEVTAGVMYKCSCARGYTGAHCQELVVMESPCQSNPCLSGGSCMETTDRQFVCNCVQGYEGRHCESVSAAAFRSTSSSSSRNSSAGLDDSVIPQFDGDSYIAIKLPKSASRSLSFEIWFLANKPNGALLYSSQPEIIHGDFFSLNLVNGFLQMRYNLGSGIANITSGSRIKLGQWNKVLVSRRDRTGMLALNDEYPVKGQAGGDKKDLNLPTKLFIGGYPGRYHMDSDITSGFRGAIQRVYRDGLWIQNLQSEAMDQLRITPYNGHPCPLQNGPCKNNGKCTPILNDFECTCTELFTGRTCEHDFKKSQQKLFKNVQKILFDGETYHKYQNTITRSERSQEENKIEIRFRTEVGHGLLLLMHKTNNVEGDYLALAVRDGIVEASFNLGKESTKDLLIMKSRVNVTDGLWHSVIFERKKRFAELTVDNEYPTVTSLASFGATHLDTDGYLWMGGGETIPWGLSESYFSKFRGCVEYLRLDGSLVDLVEDRINHNTVIGFCNHSTKHHHQSNRRN